MNINAARINAVHNRAMESAESAFAAERRGDAQRALRLFEIAFQGEAKVARAVAELDPHPEPTRSVLLRSAASLAIKCGRLRESEQLVAVALAGEPPVEIADELRDILEEGYLERHLSLRGMTLDPTEFQMTLVGRKVAPGLSECGQFLRRAEYTERILMRTEQRLKKLGFESRPNRGANHFETFLQAPRAASFAITIRLGRPREQVLENVVNHDSPVFVSAGAVVEESLRCIDLFSQDDSSALRKKIGDDDYYWNFVELAKKLSPDGEDVTTVGFTSHTTGGERVIALTSPPGATWKRQPERGATHQIVTGHLLAADEIRSNHTIGIVGIDGTKHVGIVAGPGMLEDIVRPHWGHMVTVKYEVSGKTRRLLEIDTAGDPE